MCRQYPIINCVFSVSSPTQSFLNHAIQLLLFDLDHLYLGTNLTGSDSWSTRPRMTVQMFGLPLLLIRCCPSEGLLMHAITYVHVQPLISRLCRRRWSSIYISLIPASFGGDNLPPQRSIDPWCNTGTFELRSTFSSF